MQLAMLQALYEVLRREGITFNKATLALLAVLHKMTPGVIVTQQVPVTCNNTGKTHTTHTHTYTHSCMPYSRSVTHKSIKCVSAMMLTSFQFQLKHTPHTQTHTPILSHVQPDSHTMSSCCTHAPLYK